MRFDRTGRQQQLHARLRQAAIDGDQIDNELRDAILNLLDRQHGLKPLLCASCASAHHNRCEGCSCECNDAAGPITEGTLKDRCPDPFCSPSDKCPECRVKQVPEGRFAHVEGCPRRDDERAYCSTPGWCHDLRDAHERAARQDGLSAND